MSTHVTDFLLLFKLLLSSMLSASKAERRRRDDFRLMPRAEVLRKLRAEPHRLRLSLSLVRSVRLRRMSSIRFTCTE